MSRSRNTGTTIVSACWPSHRWMTLPNCRAVARVARDRLASAAWLDAVVLRAKPLGHFRFSPADSQLHLDEYGHSVPTLINSRSCRGRTSTGSMSRRMPARDSLITVHARAAIPRLAKQETWIGSFSTPAWNCRSRHPALGPMRRVRCSTLMDCGTSCSR